MSAPNTPRLAPGNCSAVWDHSGDPVWGTAAPARFWLAVEHRGPWGAKAFTQSRLDPHVGAALEQGPAAAGGRALLIRSSSPERKAHTGRYPRRIYVAGGVPQGQPWLLTGEQDDLSAVVALPWAQIAAGDHAAVLAQAPWLHPSNEAIAFVCANSQRDLCCSLRGRPLAGASAAMLPGRVWECSHTGGHRFAPTGVLAPLGITLGRIPDAQTLCTALAAASASGAGFGAAWIPPGLATGRHLRGLAHLSGPHQAADGFIRENFAVAEVFALTVSDDPSVRLPAHCAGRRHHGVRVSHRDGRLWRLRVTELDSAARAVSCGAAPVSATAFHVRIEHAD